jgi:hypothetical protein
MTATCMSTVLTVDIQYPISHFINTEISMRKTVQLLSLHGGQGHIHCTVVVAAKLGNASVNGKIYCVIPDVMHLCSNFVSIYSFVYNDSSSFYTLSDHDLPLEQVL